MTARVRLFVRARADYSQGHDDDCMGWEDCHCGRYVNPYRT